MDWNFDMRSAPSGERLFLLLEHGEKGNGELAVGMVMEGYTDHYWTWGGPNSGSDINEYPIAWALLPSNWHVAPKVIEHA